MNPVQVFDGHNDVLLRLWVKTGGDPVADFLKGDGLGHMDMPRMKKGGFAGGFFAIFAPTDGEDLPDDDEEVNPPLSGQIAQPAALRKTLEMAALLFRIERRVRGEIQGLPDGGRNPGMPGEWCHGRDLPYRRGGGD